MASFTRFLAVGSPELADIARVAMMHTNTGPSIAPQFSADIDYEMQDDSSFPAKILASSIMYDSTLLRSRSHIVQQVPQLGDDAIINMSQFAYSNDTIMTVQNGQCLSASGSSAGGGFFAQFGWLALADHVGSTSVAGRICDLYNYTVPAVASLSICLDGDEPIQMNITQSSYSQVQTYRNFRRETDAATLAPPTICDGPPEACGSGNITKRTLYIFHPDNNFNMAGQDVADLLGDATFLCSDKFMWVAGGYSLFSAFEVSWLEKFGQYANCPPDPTSPTGARCMGGDDFHIGRSTAFLMGDNQGQCDGDAPQFYERLGVWYSMPVNGECKDGQELGKDCTWKVERRVKTLDMGCLFDKFGLDKLCDNASAPFTNVALSLIKAIDSESTSEGGCPPVEPPSSCAANPGCAGLQGDCCPAADGVRLACCSQQVIV
jgi:hypothetical protein